MIENLEKKEKALLVGVNVNHNPYFEVSMKELENLAQACYIDTVGKIEQNLEMINKSLYMGTGKVEEVKEQAQKLEADIIIFNNELSHSQLRNLQKLLNVPILDRTALILQIFAKRAQTKEAKLQVEVARLKYMLPRLVGLHSSLGRQGGGSGLSNKGSGEKKLELDRRRIEDKLVELNKELENLNENREVQSRKRKSTGIPLVALVGYTNAGKSTIMNAFIDMYVKEESKKVLEKNMLFATLETSVRNIILEDHKSFLLSDTVGFISQLPHGLIKAFRSTLNQVQEADLLLQVVDVSDPNYLEQIEVTNATLKEIGADDIPVFYVYNKADLLNVKIPKIVEDGIYISASNKIGIKELVEEIKKKIYVDFVDATFLIPFDKGSIISYFNEVTTVLKTQYLENGTYIKVNCKKELIEKYKEYLMEE